MLHAGLTTDEQPKYLQDVYRILKSGEGWTQFIELSGHRFENNIIPEDAEVRSTVHADLHVY